MINKYWSKKKKIDWLDDNYTFISDRNWGGSWVYNVDGPPYQEVVATIDDITQPKGLNVNYGKIKEEIN